MNTTAHKRIVVPLLFAAFSLLLALSHLILDLGMYALDARAFALAPGVVCYRSDVDPESGAGKALQRHEAVHEQQMLECGVLPFWIWCIRDCLGLPSPYNMMEREARMAEREGWLTYRYIEFGSKAPWSTDEGGLPWLDRKPSGA